MKCIPVDELLEYAAGLKDRDPAVAEHLVECSECAQKRDEAQQLIHGIGPSPAEFDDPTFLSDVMTLVRLGQARPDKLGLDKEPRSRSWLKVSLIAASVSFLTLALIWQIGDKKEQSEFTARGADIEVEGRWVSISVFRALDNEQYKKVDKSIRSDDALAFSYTNGGDYPYDYLMIFAVDTHGEVFWYYPAYEDESTNPLSIDIRPSAEPIPLKEQVRHELNGGKIRIFALFSKEALDVRGVEQIISEDYSDPGDLTERNELSIDGTVQQSYLFSVIDE